MTENRMLKAALKYAEIGWHVIPLHEPLFDAADSHGKPTRCTCEEWRRYAGSRYTPADPDYECDKAGKHPRHGNWETRATCDAGQIRKWWRAWPNANIGIACGPTGLVAIDIDSYKEAAAAGAALDAADSETVTNLTGGGGQHLIYLHPEDGPQIGNADGNLPDWVNVRGWGGQFVAPPSVHSSGNRYEWETGYSPLDHAVAPLPEGLRALLQPTKGKGKRAAAVSEKIAAGKRNQTLASLAGTMRRRGMTEGAIQAALLVANDEQCDPPLPEGEIEAIAKSVAKYAPTAPAAAVPALPPPDDATAPDAPHEPARYSTWADTAALLGPITWSWPRWLPNGMLTILASEPGDGKSALALRVVATMIGHSEEWPDGAPFEGEPGRVVWAESEAGHAINLERAKGWGLDTTRIIQPGLPLEDFRLDDAPKMDALRELAYLPDVRAVVIDSLRGANSRNENDSDVIALVMALGQLARDTNKPIILTHHLRKRGLLDGPGGPSLDRLRGSSAITQPARVVWVIDTPDPQDKETRRLAQAKNNLGRFPEALGMTISTAGVQFVDAPEAPHPVSQQDAAVNFLLALLKDEAMPSVDVLEHARLAGHSDRTVKRAKDKLGIVSLKRTTGWYWGLPAKDN